MSFSFSVLRRNGDVTNFDSLKIKVAIQKAFIASEGQSAAYADHVVDAVEQLTNQVVESLKRQYSSNASIHIEDIQDKVEQALMSKNHHAIARLYILYREQRAQERLKTVVRQNQSIRVKYHGELKDLNIENLHKVIADAAIGLRGINPELIIKDTLRNLYDGIPFIQVLDCAVLSARTLIEKNPDYSFAASRILLHALREEVLGLEVFQPQAKNFYAAQFEHYINKGIEAKLLNPELLNFDIQKLASAIKPEQDLKITYLGLQTLYDRYFLHIKNTRIELPQWFFMRVAMGLALKETNREEKTIEFYNLLSSFDFMSSTPTLFNSATLRSQLSSCYLSTIGDDLESIYDGLKDNALLSKFAGGLGNDWTNVRALGSWIKGTNGKSQGVIPFLKVANDTLVAVNQCFAPDTLLFTANGIKKIAEIDTKDLVLGISGKYRQVLKKLTYNQTDKMLAIKVKHSINDIQVTDGHPFYAIKNVPLEQSNKRTIEWLNKNKIKSEWIEGKDLAVGDYIAQVIPKEVNVVQGFEADDARLYGILLGDGHIAKQNNEWGVSGNPQKDEHLAFVQEYLNQRGIHFWITGRGDTYQQIRWANSYGVLRNTGTGRFVSGSETTMPFSYEDLYDTNGNKRISSRFMHLPPEQTLALIQGLLETDGGISRGKEIYFTNTSQNLIEGLRYQCLRLGIPTSGQYRERKQNHQGMRSDGSIIKFNNTTCAYDLRIPAVEKIAKLVKCIPIKKQNWLNYNGFIFSRIRKISQIKAKPFVFDLIVDGDESYMTAAGLAHNGGKRLGSGCAYLETWHLDIEGFLELRKNTGDERRRCHDMNTANWIPDLFMKRVINKQDWTLFSPSDVPDLHDLYGKAFETKYEEYEKLAQNGEISLFKTVPAIDLWRKMLTMLFETGHPWITFKDPCNIRSPQQHAGIVHSSNLCTEITLNTSDDEIAVCNLGSVNLVNHLHQKIDGTWGLDLEKLQKTITTAIRMLDNVIDINFYPVKKAENSNMRHRPIGMGMMGFQDCLHKMSIPYASEKAVAFADNSTEAICYYAYLASSKLAAERGTYSTYEGSLWSRGIMPQDTIDMVRQERGGFVEVDMSSTLDWDALRQHIKQNGMRNSNCIAIAPTATISNIIGVSASIEPTYQNLYVKSNLSGEFTIINNYLAKDLQALGLWDEVMIADLKYFDGSMSSIRRIPQYIKDIYATAFEVDAVWLVECASRRQKWIDQAQSLNIYVKGINGKKLDEIYKLGWTKCLKTFYYLRTMGATHAEKSTMHTSNLNAVSSGNEEVQEQACYLRPGDKGFEECESCQ